MDDPFVSCPYVKNHRVPRSRIQAHIVKCQEKHANLATCPYNATHRLPQADIKAHVLVCPSKQVIFPEEKLSKSVAYMSPKPILQRDYLPETDPNHEVWDD